jgi:transposase-like protein
MSKDKIQPLEKQHHSLIDDPLTEVLQDGARKLLADAVEAEVARFIDHYRQLRLDDGRQRIVRNGYLPEREIQTGIGPVAVKAPRVRDRTARKRKIRFTSNILPKYLRKTKSLEALIPWLYLKGVSTGDFAEALAALVGRDAPGLSPATISRLKAVWTEELKAWQQRDLSTKQYVYFWADGVYFNVRHEHEKQCMLIIIGATAEGRKELIGLIDGFRESAPCWRELLLDLKARGLKMGPKLAVGDGALGFWKALAEIYPGCRQQRCWVHKTANVLNKLPKSQQAKAKGRVHDIWQAESREAAEKAFDLFLEIYQAKYPKVAECLAKDREELLAFYDFPAEHWVHLRTTNPIESTFATVRLRTAKTRGCISRETGLTMVHQLVQSAEKRWRRLNGYDQIVHVLENVTFIDGIHPETIAA